MGRLGVTPEKRLVNVKSGGGRGYRSRVIDIGADAGGRGPGVGFDGTLSGFPLPLRLDDRCGAAPQEGGGPHRRRLQAAACIVGEIGLDHSVPAKEWKKQEQTLKELLPHVPAGRPVVIHIRGPNGDEEAMATYARMMELLLTYLPSEQPLFLHCFSGGEETVLEWLRTFPNIYFGYAGQVWGFNSDQVAGLRVVPLDRLLAETDSPYMPPEGHRRNSPALLCLVGDLVAEARGMTTKDFLRAATENATRLFWW
ncbi:uncharacterized metal-dependent hydrolase YcfH-like [Haliotis asinina]|uniref:uncharacterized metal-dependent hydrolase YcfH-like n=1 Tax=Haliotis asinina TaxID=109174 RepID=UPI003532334C